MCLGDINLTKFDTLINVQLFAQLEWRKREKKRPKTCVFTRKKTKKRKNEYFLKYPENTGTAGRRGVGTLQFRAVPGTPIPGVLRFRIRVPGSP